MRSVLTSNTGTPDETAHAVVDPPLLLFALVRIDSPVRGQGVTELPLMPFLENIDSAAVAEKHAEVNQLCNLLQPLTLEGHTKAVYGVAFAPDGKRIVTASKDNTVRVWDAATGKELLKLEGHTGSLIGVAFAPDGQRIVTASDDKTARVWIVD